MLEVRGDSITTAQETSSQRKQKRSANGPGHEPGANARKRLKVAESWTSCVGELPYPANGIAESSSHLDGKAILYAMTGFSLIESLKTPSSTASTPWNK